MYYWIKASPLHLTAKEEVSKEGKREKHSLLETLSSFWITFSGAHLQLQTLQKKKNKKTKKNSSIAVQVFFLFVFSKHYLDIKG